jgi:hypothetical protein
MVETEDTKSCRLSIKVKTILRSLQNVEDTLQNISLGTIL